MEAGDRAAGDRDEREREQLAREHRTFAGGRKRRERRHAERRQDDQNRDGQHEHCRDLQERREIVARAQEYPDRQHRRDEPVRDQHPGDRRAALNEGRGERWVARDAAAADQCANQQHGAHYGSLADPSWPPPLHPRAHEQGDGNRTGDRKQSPRRRPQRVHHDERQHREEDDHDREYGDHGGYACRLADFFLRHLSQRFAVAPQRAEEDREILNRAAEDHADHEPKRAGQEAELRGEHRSHQRSRASDGCEVVAEQHPAVRRHEVVAVVEPLGGRRALRVETKDFVGEEPRIEPVGDDVGADGGGQEPGGIDHLTADEGKHPECGRAEQGNQTPDHHRHARKLLSCLPMFKFEHRFELLEPC